METQVCAGVVDGQAAVASRPSRFLPQPSSNFLVTHSDSFSSFVHSFVWTPLFIHTAYFTHHQAPVVILSLIERLCFYGGTYPLSPDGVHVVCTVGCGKKKLSTPLPAHLPSCAGVLVYPDWIIYLQVSSKRSQASVGRRALPEETSWPVWTKTQHRTPQI